MSRNAPLLLCLALGCRTGSAPLKEAPSDDVDPPGGDSFGDDPVDPADTADTGDGPPPEDPYAPWIRQELQSPGPITFTEVHYHPLTDDEVDQPLEYVELFNPMVLDVDLSGWALTGAVGWTFPEGTVVSAGDFIVVAASPDELQAATGYVGALGPFERQLANSGERIELVSLSGRRIDSVAYQDVDPWTVLADGSGFTLAKLDLDAASDRAEHWTVSTQLNGTPGADNGLDPLTPPVVEVWVDEEATWRYDASGEEAADGWPTTGFDDRSWDEGQAVFFAGGTDGPVFATAWATADNYFALYAGLADGSSLRLLGEDSDGSWTTVEEMMFELDADEHLYLAAWELVGDSGSPQMVIGEVELPDASFGTNATDWEWVLGPTDATPGGLPAALPPAEVDLTALIVDANTDGSWTAPAVEASRSSSPWGSSVGSGFTDVASFIWADTFASASVTNTEDTFALFRTTSAAVAPRGNVELDSVPTQALFRTHFEADADPASTELLLQCTIDDGAVVYLNGDEVYRHNLPTGALDESTLAAAEVDRAESVTVWIATDALTWGDNVLAVGLHQALEDDGDLTFGCSLTARISDQLVVPTVRISEVPGLVDGDLWLELVNTSSLPQELGDLYLQASGGGTARVGTGTLDPGALIVVEDIDLDIALGHRLFLLADGPTLLDGVRVGERGRAWDSGWWTPTEPTPGAANLIETTDGIVIHEIQYHRAPVLEEGEPFTERDDEWIELFNRGDAAVDLSGWQLTDAVAYTFPDGTVLDAGDFLVVAGDSDALLEAHPDIVVLGDFDGRLGNSGDRVLLRDAWGNPADEVRYYDGGRWPWEADGGGATLELTDPWADNATAEAWAASDEGRHAQWQDISIRGTAGRSSVGPDGVWEELVLGLLDQGELLIDDLSVVRDPDNAAVELVPNGGFDDDDRWRLLGTHRHSEVVPDPDDGSNTVLRLVATDPTGHMHNHAETTLLSAVGTGEVEVSFRARWVRGSNQLHSRLYFNRLPTTSLIARPETAGTPGAPNSTAVDNAGPTFAGLAHLPAVPEDNEAVQVSIDVTDPDEVAEVTLWTSVDGAAFEGASMVEGELGRYTATLDGQSAGAVVQLYVEATDSLGESATYPAKGADSRALYAVRDSAGSTTGLHDLRIVLTEADADWMHQDVHLMSNDLTGATVVYRDTEVFYDVGVRLKGSQRGRPTAARVGYGVRFNDDHLFRGSHSSVMIDRSEGVGYGQREVLLNLAMTRAGSVTGEHNDVVHLIAPRSAYTGPAELQLDRFSSLVLDAQFDDGADGTRFEYELIYYPTSTDDGTPEGLKLPQPDLVVGADITDLGNDPEDYRWIWLIKNNAAADDYSGVMQLTELFSLPTDDMISQAESVIDVDQWLRAFAMATLAGVTDQYGGAGSQHNVQFYVRPSDGKVLHLPHDLDFYSSAYMSVVNNRDLARLVQNPEWLRLYYAHLHDLLDTSYTSAWMGPWCDQLGDLLPGQSFDSHCAYMDTRAAYVRSGSSESVEARFPPVDFEITTGDVTVSTDTVTLDGTGWVDVRGLVWTETGTPVELEWGDDQSWQVTLPIILGPNPVTLEALDMHGEVVGTDTVLVVRE